LEVEKVGVWDNILYALVYTARVDDACANKMFFVIDILDHTHFYVQTLSQEKKYRRRGSHCRLLWYIFLVWWSPRTLAAATSIPGCMMNESSPPGDISNS